MSWDPVSDKVYTGGIWWATKNLDIVISGSTVSGKPRHVEFCGYHAYSVGTLDDLDAISEVAPAGWRIASSADWDNLASAAATDYTDNHAARALKALGFNGDDIYGVGLDAGPIAYWDSTDVVSVLMYPQNTGMSYFTPDTPSGIVYDVGAYFYDLAVNPTQARYLYRNLDDISLTGVSGDKLVPIRLVSDAPAPTTPPPSIYPPQGTYQGVQLVVLKSSQSLPIHYTMDGSEPTISSPLYVGPIPVYQDTQVKAAAFYGSIPSDTVTASYTITNGILKRISSYRDRVLPYLLEQYKGDNT